jgi:hypothetical protein
MTNESGPTRPSEPDITTVRIAQEIPIIFIDGVHSHSFAFGVSKLLLSRWDPTPGGGLNKETVVVQIVMPTENFVKSVAFLEHRLRFMIQSKAITQEQVDEARKFWADQEPGNVAR